jgi:hypothetical protein
VRSKLRHPIRSIREPFGTAGLIVACIALIAALGGSAIAAGKLTSKQKKEVEKIAKKYAGKPGAPGATGPAGPPGAKGDPGAPGAAGTNGTNGTNGVSPVGTIFSGNQKGCTEGGVEFKGTNTTVACNGVKGANGETGFTETLPPGKTLSGAWTVDLFGASPATYEVEGGKVEEEKVTGKVTVITAPFGASSISFGIPLSEAPTFVFASREIEACSEPEKAACEASIKAKCPGSAAEPTAAPGFLCLYEQASSFITPLKWTGTTKQITEESLTASGISLLMAKPSFEFGGMSFGSWAVTAPEEEP